MTILLTLGRRQQQNPKKSRAISIHFLCAQFKFSAIPVENVCLKANITTELDKIPPKILKIRARIAATCLTYILNFSHATGIYIDYWKRARVTTIYKSGERRQCATYHQISILPSVNKVLKREVFRQVYGYLTENCMLSKFKSGLNHSTGFHSNAF